jgi:hypothetical protein
MINVCNPEISLADEAGATNFKRWNGTIDDISKIARSLFIRPEEDIFLGDKIDGSATDVHEDIITGFIKGFNAFADSVGRA